MTLSLLFVNARGTFTAAKNKISGKDKAWTLVYLKNCKSLKTTVGRLVARTSAGEQFLFCALPAALCQAKAGILIFVAV